MLVKTNAAGDLQIGESLLRQLKNEARAALPAECCGLLLGRFGRLQTARTTPNVHPIPQTHFEIDPQALIDAHRAARAGGPQLMGYFHSHPTGEAVPSATDRAMAASDGRVWAIIAGDDVRFWCDDPGGFRALSYVTVKG